MQPEVYLLPSWIPEGSTFRKAANALIDRLGPDSFYSSILEEQPLLSSYALTVPIETQVVTGVTLTVGAQARALPVTDNIYDVLGEQLPIALVTEDAVLLFNTHHVTASPTYTVSGSYWVVEPPSDADERCYWYFGTSGSWTRALPGRAMKTIPNTGAVVVYTPADHYERLQQTTVQINGTTVAYTVHPTWTILEEWRLRYGLDRRDWWPNEYITNAILARRHAPLSVCKPWWGFCADLGLTVPISLQVGTNVMDRDDVWDIASEQQVRHIDLAVLYDMPSGNVNALYPDVRYWLDGDMLSTGPRSLQSLGVRYVEPFVLRRSGDFVSLAISETEQDGVACIGAQTGLGDRWFMPTLWDMPSPYGWHSSTDILVETPTAVISVGTILDLLFWQGVWTSSS